MDNNKEWRLKPYKEGDEEGIFELKKAVYPDREFDRKLWLKQWRWMFKENPSGEGIISLAEYNGHIVGYYAMRPVLFKAGDRIILASQAGGVMTHPSYRRQGIHKALGREICEEAAKKNISIIYGFPNTLSYPGLIKKLNRFTVAKLRGLIKIINWENYLKNRIHNNILMHLSSRGARFAQMMFFKQSKEYTGSNLLVHRAPVFDERINELWSRISNQYQLIAVRRRENLNWRFIDIPGVDYNVYLAEKNGRVDGYIVFRHLREAYVIECKIMDIFAESGNVAESLVSKVLENCIQNGIDKISCQMIAQKPYFEAFKKNGFIIMPYKKHGWLTLYSDWSRFSKEFLLDPNNWFIQPGDSDTY